VKTLGKYLKPGGILAVWLYSGYNKWYRSAISGDATRTK